MERGLLYAIGLLVPVLSLQPIPALGILSIFDFFFLPLLVMWGKRKLSSTDRIFYPSCLKQPLLLLMLGALVATVFATDPSSSAFGILVSVRFYLFFRVFIDILEDVRQLRLLLQFVALGVAVSAAIGLAQGMLGINITILPALNQNASATIAGRQVVRTVGPFANSLNFAQYLSVTVFTLAALPGARRTRWLMLALALVTSLALLQTLSRGPVLAAAVGGLAFAGLHLRGRALLRLVTVGALVASLTVLPVFGTPVVQTLVGGNLFARFAELAERYDQNIRYGLWTAAAAEADRHLLGVGLRNSDYAIRWPPVARAVPGYFPYDTRSWKPFNFHFENVYVAVYMNIGLIGLMGFLILMYRAVNVPWRTFTAGDDELRIVSRIVLAANVSIALNMLTNPGILSNLGLMVLFWSLLGSVAFLWKVSSPRSGQP